MTRALLIRNIGQLLTLRGPAGPRRGEALRELGILNGGAVLTSGGSIVAAGPAADVESLAAAITEKTFSRKGLP